MFELKKFLEDNPAFNELNDNQYIALYTILNDEKKYLTVDKTLTCDKQKMLIKKKCDLVKGFAYLETMSTLNLKFEKYVKIMSSDTHMSVFKLEESDILYDIEYFPETDEWYDVKTGRTDIEQQIADHCVEIVNLMSIAPKHHPSHNNDVCDAIHVIQRILQSRSCHRLYPEIYPIKNGMVNE